MHPLLLKARRAGLSRRDFLRNLLFTAGSVSTATWLTACGSSESPADGLVPPGRSPFADLGPLQAPDENGLSLPAGFSSRVIAVSGEAPLASKPGFSWHSLPDGGGSFALADGGWLYVSNCESRDLTSIFLPRELSFLQGGASALRFSADGTLVDAYSILKGTTTNCSGTATPWGTWLCGEEILDGYAFECDPLGGDTAGRRIDALGRFAHEQMAIDVASRTIYHTEDLGGNERFYRTVFSAADWPAGERPALQDGVLQALAVEGGIEAARAGIAPIRWIDVDSPGQPQWQHYRNDTTIFSGNEGVWFFEGIVFFSTKSDNTIWAIDTVGQTIERIYAPEISPTPILSGVDNLCMTDDGDIIVVEDGGDMQACVILPDRTVVPLLQISDQEGNSEVTGPSFSPDGRRFYCSSQRGGRNGSTGDGITFEVTLPFAVRVTRPRVG